MRIHLRTIVRLAVVAVPLAVFAYFLVYANHYLGAGRLYTAPIPVGDFLPPPAPGPEDPPPPRTGLGQATIQHFAERPLPAWEDGGKVISPRIWLAKLLTGREVAEVNARIRELTPWGYAGSRWWAHPDGDYDFTLTVLVTLLYLVGDDPALLTPETRAHLLDVLMTRKGGTPLVTVPRSFGLVLDTENHHLMTNGSQYLTNQWLRTHEGRTDPAFDNTTNGLEAWLIAYLEEIRDEGVYEFNSIPYLAYTIHPLLNLEAFAESAEIRDLARYLLDLMSLEYALGSLDFRRVAPFRRQERHADRTSLSDDPHTAAMRVWLDDPYEPGQALPPATGHSSASFAAAVLPYRPAPDVRFWTREKPAPYFAQFGRGPEATPEIYSGGPGYLLAAGGVHRGWRSHIVARPITLLLSDGATDLSECFHIVGRGDWRRWNNTGVHQHFAVANGPVHVPAQYAPVAVSGEWRVFAPEAVPGLQIVVLSRDDLGLIALFPDSPYEADELLTILEAFNHAPHALRRAFTWPDRTVVHYSVDTPAGNWVLHSWRGDAFERDYDAWPRLDGTPPKISFVRSVFNYAPAEDTADADAP